MVVLVVMFGVVFGGVFDVGGVSGFIVVLGVDGVGGFGIVVAVGVFGGIIGDVLVVLVVGFFWLCCWWLFANIQCYQGLHRSYKIHFGFYCLYLL